MLFISIGKVHTVPSGKQTSLLTHQKEQPKTEVGPHNTSTPGQGFVGAEMETEVAHQGKCYFAWGNTGERTPKGSIAAFL